MTLKLGKNYLAAVGGGFFAAIVVLTGLDPSPDGLKLTIIQTFLDSVFPTLTEPINFGFLVLGVIGLCGAAWAYFEDKDRLTVGTGTVLGFLVAVGWFSGWFEGILAVLMGTGLLIALIAPEVYGMG